MRELVGIADVQEMTGIPAPTWRYWRREKVGPRSAKLGRRVVYDKAEVEAWIEAQFNAETSPDADDPTPADTDAAPEEPSRLATRQAKAKVNGQSGPTPD